jgi:hypothetical protein
LLLYQCESETACLTWTWDGTKWEEHSTPTNPGYLSDVSIAYDDVRREVVLFGGSDYVQSESHTTWTWDGSTWTMHDQSNVPKPRIGAAMAFDKPHGTMLLFGGSTNFSPFGPLGDTWEWDGQVWTEVYPIASPPVAAAQMTYDAATHQIVLISGMDIWTWDGRTWSMPIQSMGPPASDNIAYDPIQQQVIVVSDYPGCVFFGP